MAQSLGTGAGPVGTPEDKRDLFGPADPRDTDNASFADAPAIPLGHDNSTQSGPDEARIRRLLKLRASRNDIFGERLFHDPAWDILLELYAAGLAGKNETVSNICIASGVPSTTAIRWIRHLEENGWIFRTDDADDGRRCFLFLTRKAEAAIQRVFAQPGSPELL